MFDAQTYRLPDKVYKKEEVEKKFSKLPQLGARLTDIDMICEEITISGITYKKGDLVVQRMIDGGFKMLIGQIKLIIVQNDEVIYLCYQCVAEKTDLGYFKGSLEDSRMELVKAVSLADVKPLIMRGTSAAFIFVMHHFVSFEYE